MSRKLAAAVVVCLVVPGMALAAKPTPPGQSQQQHGNAKVMYVLRGTLSAYTPANGTTPGTISILVKYANRHGRALKTLGAPLTFTVTSKTRIRLTHGLTVISDGDLGIVKVRAPKVPWTTSATDLQTLLQSQSATFQVIDLKAGSSS